MSQYFPTTSKKVRPAEAGKSLERDINELLLYRLTLEECRLKGCLDIVNKEQKEVAGRLTEKQNEIDELCLVERLAQFVELNEAHAKLCQLVVDQGEGPDSSVLRNLQDHIEERAHRLKNGIDMILYLIDSIK